MSKKAKGVKAPKEKKTVSTATKNSVTIAGTKKTSADSIVVKGRGRTSKFGPVLDEARTLKIGDALEVALDKSDHKTLVNTRNWLATLLKKHVEAPKGAALVARTTEDGKLAIICEKAS